MPTTLIAFTPDAALVCLALLTWYALATVAQTAARVLSRSFARWRGARDARAPAPGADTASSDELGDGRANDTGPTTTP